MMIKTLVRMAKGATGGSSHHLLILLLAFAHFVSAASSMIASTTVPEASMSTINIPYPTGLLDDLLRCKDARFCDTYPSCARSCLDIASGGMAAIVSMSSWDDICGHKNDPGIGSALMAIWSCVITGCNSQSQAVFDHFVDDCVNKTGYGVPLSLIPKSYTQKSVPLLPTSTSTAPKSNPTGILTVPQPFSPSDGSSSSPPSGGLSPGAQAGISVASVVIAAVALFIAYRQLKEARKQRKKQQEAN